MNSNKTSYSLYIFLNCICTVLSISASECHNKRAVGCFQCRTLMNRQWAENLPNCMGNKSDCGKCIEGFSAKHQDKICDSLDKITVEKNGTAFVPEEATVIIKCLFREIVECRWEYKKKYVDIKGQLSYTGTEQIRRRSKDCSIQIVQFENAKHSGEWECLHILANIRYSETTVKLVNESVITAQGKDKDVLIPIRGPVILNCRFDELVDCVWKLNGLAVTVSGRYQYTNIKNGRQVDDCSITITSFHETDVGNWSCQTLATTTKPQIISTSVRLLKVEDPASVVNPQNDFALVGVKLVLACKFNAEVECEWKLNGLEVSKSQYIFLEKDRLIRKDCSIEIPLFNEMHYGPWACGYKGSSIVHNISNTARITRMQKPSVPEIVDKEQSSSDMNVAIQFKVDKIINCTSKNGRPVAKLRWELDGATLEASTTTTTLTFDATITLDFSYHKHRFRPGFSVLKCIASHPMLAKDVIDERIVVITNGDHLNQESESTEMQNERIAAIVAGTLGGVISVLIITGAIVYFLRGQTIKPNKEKNNVEGTPSKPENFKVPARKEKDTVHFFKEATPGINADSSIEILKFPANTTENLKASLLLNKVKIPKKDEDSDGYLTPSNHASPLIAKGKISNAKLSKDPSMEHENEYSEIS